MKYESTILKRLIDTYGVVGNPRYISEIIKGFIVRGKECFPNLFTYQSDWLTHIDEFGLNPTYTVSYTGQSIYAPNTLERPVKSAILTGNTLVNLLTQKSSTIKYTTRTEIDRGYRYTQEYSESMTATRIQWDTTEEGHNRLKPNTKYYVQFTVKVNKSRNVRVSFEGGNEYTTSLAENSTTTIKCSVLSGETLKRFYVYIFPPVDTSYTDDTFDILDFIIIEYQEGMENWDIPYFEGMQSVKMPVLKTTGKNLFDSNNLVVKAENTYGYIDFTDYDGKLTFSIRDKDTSIDMSGIFFGATYQGCDYNETNTNNGGWLFANGEFKMSSLTTSKCKYFSFHPNSNSALDKIIARYDIQVEESSQPTSYEPYKSNILTVNEPVELRGIGEVRDTLDCLTGEVTERIGEIMLDGSEDWKLANPVSNNNNNLRLYCTIETAKSGLFTKGVISNRFATVDTVNYEGIAFTSSNKNLHISINKTKLDEISVNGFKQWLSQNPVTVQYQLETESIKTVDLNILDQNEQNVQQLMSFNGGTHFNTTSSEGSLLPVASVSVETDLEEVLMICSLEGNTL